TVPRAVAVSTGWFHPEPEDHFSSTTQSPGTIAHRAPQFSLTASIRKPSSSTISLSPLILRTQLSVERLMPVCRHSGSMTFFPLRVFLTQAHVQTRQAPTATSRRILHSRIHQREITVCTSIPLQLTQALPTEHRQRIWMVSHVRWMEMVTELQSLIWEPMRRR